MADVYPSELAFFTPMDLHTNRLGSGFGGLPGCLELVAEPLE